MTPNDPLARTLILVSTIFFLSGCVSGPKRENDSALDYLNGHNYQAGSTVGISPVVVRQAPAMTVSGVLLVSADPLPLPLKYQKMVLTRGGSEIARSMTDSTGAFVFTGDIPNGSYSVAVDSDRYALSQSVEVSSYKTEGLHLVAAVKGL